MGTLINNVLRLLQVFFVLVATALIGNVRANTTHRAAGSATVAIDFNLFVCAVSWIAALYNLAAHFVSVIAIPIATLALDALAILFTFIGAVVLSAKLTTVNCANPGSKPYDWIAYGSVDTQKRCREIQSGLVFMWFLFAAFTATLLLAFKEFRRNGGSVRGPNMSQISA